MNNSKSYLPYLIPSALVLCCLIYVDQRVRPLLRLRKLNKKGKDGSSKRAIQRVNAQETTLPFLGDSAALVKEPEKECAHHDYGRDQESVNSYSSMLSCDTVELEQLHEHRDEYGQISRPTVTFDQIVGHETIKADLRDIIHQLQNPEVKAKRKGMILHGPPGVAKTMLVKALACESKCAIIPLSAAYLLQNGRGKCSVRLRKAFIKARQNKPCVLFIDEIDRVAKELTAELLSQLDGFDSSQNEGIIAIAASNNLNALSGALTRKGRFDFAVRVDLPDQKERLLLLKMYAVDAPIDYETYASLTEGMSGADIQSLSNEAAILAYRERRTWESRDFEQAFLRHHLGSRLSIERESDEEKRIAIHEASHAIVGLLLKRRILMLTILPYQDAEGIVWHRPGRDSISKRETQEEVYRGVVISLAGMEGEKIEYGEHTSGATADILKARETVTEMIESYGMGGPVLYIHYREGEKFDINSDYREQASALLARAQRQAQELVAKYHGKIRQLARTLLHHKTLNSTQVTQVFASAEDAC